MTQHYLPFYLPPEQQFHAQVRIAALLEKLREASEAAHAARAQEAARLQASLTQAAAAHSAEFLAERRAAGLALGQATTPLHASIAELQAEAGRARARASREAALSAAARRKAAAAAAPAVAAAAGAEASAPMPSRVTTYEGDAPVWALRHAQRVVRWAGQWLATAPPLQRAATALLMGLPLLAMALLGLLPGRRAAPPEVEVRPEGLKTLII